MEEMKKHGEVGRAAAKADMDRKTARKYIRAGKLPSELAAAPQLAYARESVFAGGLDGDLGADSRRRPELEAKTLFEWLSDQRPGIYAAGQLRTLQRHVRRWRAAHGPDREVFFAQRHRPGEAGADGLHERHGAWRHNRRPAFRAHALRLRAAVLELAMGRRSA